MGAEVRAADVLLSAVINRTTTGTLVAAVAGRKIRVVSFTVTLTGTTPTAQFRSGGATVLTGSLSGVEISNSALFPAELFETAVGESLDLVVAGTTPSAQGFVTYYLR